MPAAALFIFSELSFQQANLQTCSVAWTRRSKGRKYFTLRCGPHGQETTHTTLAEYNCCKRWLRTCFLKAKASWPDYQLIVFSIEPETSYVRQFYPFWITHFYSICFWIDFSPYLLLFMFQHMFGLSLKHRDFSRELKSLREALILTSKCWKEGCERLFSA